MNKTLRALTALALATAALTAVTSANATPLQDNVHGAVQKAQGAVKNGAGATTVTPVKAGGLVGAALNGRGVNEVPGLNQVSPPKLVGPGLHQYPPREIFPTQTQPGKVISCHPGTGCTLSPPGDHDRDHDRDHDHDYDRDHDHDRDYYRDHDHYRWWKYGWERPHYVIGGGYAPVEVVAPAPVSQVRVPATVVAQPAAPCNCLTKQYLQDGSVLFTDICSKEQAMTAPQAVGAK
jgi:hypothetical protein